MRTLLVILFSHTNIPILRCALQPLIGLARSYFTESFLGVLTAAAGLFPGMA
jgi:hypothetical protein